MSDWNTDTLRRILLLFYPSLNSDLLAAAADRIDQLERKLAEKETANLPKKVSDYECKT